MKVLVTLPELTQNQENFLKKVYPGVVIEFLSSSEPELYKDITECKCEGEGKKNIYASAKKLVDMLDLFIGIVLPIGNHAFMWKLCQVMPGDVDILFPCDGNKTFLKFSDY